MELWTQLMQSSPSSSYDRKYFTINIINNNKTIALGSYQNINNRGGANIFAFRKSVNERWNIKITQEALSCSDTNKLKEGQIIFIKKHGIENCVTFDKNGFIHKEDL